MDGITSYLLFNLIKHLINRLLNQFKPVAISDKYCILHDCNARYISENRYSGY